MPKYVILVEQHSSTKRELLIEANNAAEACGYVREAIGLGSEAELPQNTEPEFSSSLHVSEEGARARLEEFRTTEPGNEQS